MRLQEESKIEKENETCGCYGSWFCLDRGGSDGLRRKLPARSGNTAGDSCEYIRGNTAGNSNRGGRGRDGKRTDRAAEHTAQTAEKPVQTAEEYEDNFAVDSEAAKEFAEKIKDAAARKDLEALAELTAFPVYVGLPGVDVVETKEDFLKLGADAVFTDDLLESVEKADIDNFQPCMAGFPISDGRTASINFSVADGVLAINGINY